MKKDFEKRGGVVTDLVAGTGGLIVTTVVILVVVSTLLGANLLTSGSPEAHVANSTAANFTIGIRNISTKLPTILLIGAVVLLFGVIVLLVRQSQSMGIGGGSL